MARAGDARGERLADIAMRLNRRAGRQTREHDPGTLAAPVTEAHHSLSNDWLDQTSPGKPGGLILALALVPVHEAENQRTSLVMYRVAILTKALCVPDPPRGSLHHGR